jgi:hypothetical protein
VVTLVCGPDNLMWVARGAGRRPVKLFVGGYTLRVP